MGFVQTWIFTSTLKSVKYSNHSKHTVLYMCFALKGKKEKLVFCSCQIGSNSYYHQHTKVKWDFCFTSLSRLIIVRITFLLFLSNLRKRELLSCFHTLFTYAEQEQLLENKRTGLDPLFTLFLTFNKNLMYFNMFVCTYLMHRLYFYLAFI